MTQGALDLKLPYKDLPNIAETFIDGVHLMTFNGQFANLILTANRMDEPHPGNKKPTGAKVTAERLVLSPDAILDLHNRMSQLIAVLEQQGVVQRSAPVAIKNTVQ